MFFTGCRQAAYSASPSGVRDTRFFSRLNSAKPREASMAAIFLLTILAVIFSDWATFVKFICSAQRKKISICCSVKSCIS